MTASPSRIICIARAEPTQSSRVLTLPGLISLDEVGQLSNYFDGRGM
jgi:hypothetical protein